MALLNTEFLERAIRSAVASAMILRSDATTVSLMLVAPIERGKTSVALRAAKGPVLILSDISTMGIAERLMQHQTVTHIVINDLTAVMGHRHSVSTLTVATLNAIAEEGLFSIALPKSEKMTFNGRRCGVIACLTPDMLDDKRQWWTRSGFASRTLVLRFDHSIDLVSQIRASIQNDTGKKKPETSVPLKIPGGFVHISPAAAKEIAGISSDIAHYLGEAGYRKQKQLRSLACGHALLRGSRMVASRELAFLDELRAYTKGTKLL